MKYIIWNSYIILIVITWSSANKKEASQWISKVVNGIPADIEDYPYMALITAKKTNSVHCGGSIISSRVILTAAHCLKGPFGVIYDPEVFDVYLGSSLPMKGDKYEVCKTLPHEKYGNDEEYHVSNDIGLMLLKSKIKFRSNTVKKATLISNEKWEVPGRLITVIGFGLTKTYGGPPSDRLMMTRMNYVDFDTCSKSQYQFKEPIRMAPHVFCLISRYWTSDCYGDSGSPVILGRYVVGLVTAGRSHFCGSDMMPSMYTGVLHFRGWIKTNVKKLESEKCASTKKNRKRLKAKKKQILHLRWGKALNLHLRFEPTSK